MHSFIHSSLTVLLDRVSLLRIGICRGRSLCPSSCTCSPCTCPECATCSVCSLSSGANGRYGCVWQWMCVHSLVCVPLYECVVYVSICSVFCVQYSVFSILCSVFRVWMLCSFAWVAGADDVCGDCVFCVEGGSGLRVARARARRGAQVRRAQTASSSTATAVPSTSVASSFQLVERSVRVCGFVYDRNGVARRSKRTRNKLETKSLVSSIQYCLFSFNSYTCAYHPSTTCSHTRVLPSHSLAFHLHRLH